jgi:hypothetical protein
MGSTRGEPNRGLQTNQDRKLLKFVAELILKIKLVEFGSTQSLIGSCVWYSAMRAGDKAQLRAYSTTSSSLLVHNNTPIERRS